MQKALLIFATIILGAIFTFGHQFTFLIRYNLMIMLFFAFLGININLQLFSIQHLKIMIINALLPIILYFSISWIDSTYANIAFVIAIPPTAAAAPVIAEIMKVKLGEVTFSVLLTSPFIAFLLPLVLPYLLSVSNEISTLDLLLPILSLVFIPLIISQIFRHFFTKAAKNLLNYSFIIFPIFLINIFIACGNASNFVQNNEAINFQKLVGIVFVSAIICVLQFQIGQFIGKKKEPMGFSLALGRKNTMFGLWLALTYFEPIIALGPICYLVVQNIYNSIQIWQMDKRL